MVAKELSGFDCVRQHCEYRGRYGLQEPRPGPCGRAVADKCFTAAKKDLVECSMDGPAEGMACGSPQKPTLHMEARAWQNFAVKSPPFSNHPRAGAERGDTSEGGLVRQPRVSDYGTGLPRLLCNTTIAVAAAAPVLRTLRVVLPVHYCLLRQHPRLHSYSLRPPHMT